MASTPGSPAGGGGAAPVAAEDVGGSPSARFYTDSDMVGTFSTTMYEGVCGKLKKSFV